MDGKPPERIWLQWADEGDYESYDDLEGVTWCVDPINETDVEYVPAARIAELEAALLLVWESLVPDVDPDHVLDAVQKALGLEAEEEPE